jgi:hypothetical protein
MKISLSQTFLNSDDTPAIDGQTKEPITLKQILVSSLLAGQEDKIKRYNLFRDIKKSKVGFVVLNVEDVAFLKKAVLECQPTLVAGQAHEMLENEYVSEKPHSSDIGQRSSPMKEELMKLRNTILAEKLKLEKVSDNEREPPTDYGKDQ